MLRIEGHFVLLIYPFRHAVADDQAGPRLARLDARWRPWWTRLRGAGQLERALDDTYFFLPHIRRQLLFPEVALLSSDVTTHPREAEQLAGLSASSLATRLAAEGLRRSSVLRLTCDPGTLAAGLRLEPRGSDASFPVRVDWIDLVLFPQEVGFLVLKVALDEPAPSLDRLSDFLYELRFVHPPTVGWRLPAWRRKDPALEFEARDLVDFLLQGVAEDTDVVAESLDEFVTRTGAASPVRRYSTSQRGQVYGQMFRQYSYGCLLEAEAPAAEPHLEGLFDSPLERALYELATASRVSEPDSAPHPRGLARLLERGRIALWANWQGLALHDNVAFLGRGPSPFTERVLPHNVESDYFPLYLLTLYQKIRLSFMSGELMRRDVDWASNQREARKLWHAYTRFRNHYWFVEVTTRPQGIALYRQFQRGLGVRALHGAVRSEVRELREFYESEDAARVARRQAANIEIVARVQRMVEYIEIFLVSVYAAHLTHMLFEGVGSHWVHLWVATAALLGATVTARFVLPERFEFWRVSALAVAAWGALAPILLREPEHLVHGAAARLGILIGWGVLIAVVSVVLFRWPGAPPRRVRRRRAGHGGGHE